MDTIEFKLLSGFRLTLFKHKIEQLTEHALVSKQPGPTEGTETVIVRPYTEILTSFGHVHSVDEDYESVKRKAFGGE